MKVWVIGDWEGYWEGAFYTNKEARAFAKKNGWDVRGDSLTHYINKIVIEGEIEDNAFYAVQIEDDDTKVFAEFEAAMEYAERVGETKVYTSVVTRLNDCLSEFACADSYVCMSVVEVRVQ